MVEARRSLARPASQVYADPTKALRSLLRDPSVPDRLRERRRDSRPRASPRPHQARAGARHGHPPRLPAGLSWRPDGNLWFTENSGNAIGRITPLGVVTELRVGISAGAGPVGIAVGPRGDLWFTEEVANRVARISNVPGSGCVADATTLCIDQDPGDGRFRVQVSYGTVEGGGLSGPGHAITLSSLGVTAGGLFCFFSASNPEMLIKIIDGCSLGGHFWVFAAATTNVGFTVTVTDTFTGQLAVYRNQDLAAAPPVQDTGSLTCP